MHFTFFPYFPALETTTLQGASVYFEIIFGNHTFIIKYAKNFTIMSIFVIITKYGLIHSPVESLGEDAV